MSQATPSGTKAPGGGESLRRALFVLFLGAARVAAVGPVHLTMTAEEGVIAAGAFPNATIVPLHFEGWAHFSESRAEIEEVFRTAGLETRLRWPVAGSPIGL